MYSEEEEQVETLPPPPSVINLITPEPVQEAPMNLCIAEEARACSPPYGQDLLTPKELAICAITQCVQRMKENIIKYFNKLETELIHFVNKV